jgi:hypothetical protein
MASTVVGKVGDLIGKVADKYLQDYLREVFFYFFLFFHYFFFFENRSLMNMEKML